MATTSDTPSYPLYHCWEDVSGHDLSGGPDRFALFMALASPTSDGKGSSAFVEFVTDIGRTYRASVKEVSRVDDRDTALWVSGEIYIPITPDSSVARRYPYLVLYWARPQVGGWIKIGESGKAYYRRSAIKPLVDALVSVL